MDVPHPRGLGCIYYITAHRLACICGGMCMCMCFCICMFVHTLYVAHPSEKKDSCMQKDALRSWSTCLCLFPPSFSSVHCIFYQSCGPSPIRRAMLFHRCSSSPLCISHPLSHTLGSRWSDVCLLMIEPSLPNQLYHLCKLWSTPASTKAV